MRKGTDGQEGAPGGPGDSTRAVWGGESPARNGDPTQVPVVLSAAYGYGDLESWQAVALGQAPGHIYSRNTNPTVAAFEEKVRALEGGERAVSFASGMAAIANTLFALLAPGDRVVSTTDAYGGTSKLFLEFLPRWNVDCVLCDTEDPARIEREIERGLRLLYLETPTNPTLKITDIARLARRAHERGAIVVVDNTFATPINQSPLTLGADLVVHSATKFLGGHADALGGVLAGRADLAAQVYHYREIGGAALEPMSAYLLLRGMKTLALRVRQQNQSALTLARFLRGHPAVQRVFYPGLEDHPGHAVAKSQMRGFGGVLSFVPHGGFEAVGRLLPRLRYAHLAANLGAVETLAGPPRTTSHVELNEAERARLGIPEALIRYSVGIEDTADLMADLDGALGSI